MAGEVVNYNVGNDETVRDGNGDNTLTATNGDTTSRVYSDDSHFVGNRYRQTVNAPGYASSEASHNVSRLITFGLTYRLGRLDLEWQARGGAAGQ